MIFGGGQERGVRSGTENVPAIVSMAKAVELAVNGIEKRTEHVRKLAAKLAAGILTDIGQTYLNGPDFGPRRLPGNVNISFGGCNGASLVLELDKAGIACSSGSACSSGAPSAILTAMYNDEERANASLRFTLNEDNTEEEVDRVLSVLPEIVRKERERENH
jgi:cysteine desulfurase